ncbi:hypothetical protein CRE_03070 [Caenorhabditis remanei]|uniref:Uncharacterized protein n=1 Tax=Caenorhabditis remanei TaxID=31234 RepID=E3LWE2_CAERE|nr:hypothetical protein CRE_03070 [Caenorhabditis remanei]
MCFCRRKTSQREEAIDSSRRGDNSRKQCRDQPLAAPQNQMGQQQLQQQNQQQSARHVNHNNNNQEKRGEKKGKKEKTVPRGKGLTKKRGRRTREDDTISNIPDEMPDLEITREHAEPFYTDEQLM